MNKVKIFLGAASLVLAIGSAVGTKAMTTVAPDYYYDGAICKLVPVATTTCTSGLEACILDVDPSAATLNKQIYETFVNTTTCGTPLTRPQ